VSYLKGHTSAGEGTREFEALGKGGESGRKNLRKTRGEGALFTLWTETAISRVASVGPSKKLEERGSPF